MAVNPVFRASAALSLIGAATVAADPAAAQQGGALLSFDVSQEFSASDNPDFQVDGESAFVSRTGLQLGLSTVTRADALSLVVGGNLVYSDSDEVETGFVDPTVAFSYGRETRDTVLSFELNYSQTDVSTATVVPLAGDVGQDFVIIDDGTLNFLDARLGATFGRTAPVGGEIFLRHSDRSYDDVIDPDLDDRTTDEVAASAIFRIDPRIAVTASAGALETDAERDGVDETEYDAGLSAEIAVSSILDVQVGLSYSRVDLTGQGTESGIDRTEEGLGFSLGAVRDMPNGSLSARLESTIGENGRETSATIGRALELRSGLVELSLGAETTDEGDTNPLYEFVVVQEFRRARLAASLSQEISTDNNADRAINSLLSVDYTRALTRTTSFDASLTVAQTSGAGDGSGGRDASRLDATLSLRRALAQDWSLVGGYSHMQASGDTVADRTSNTVFVALDKSIDWRW